MSSSLWSYPSLGSAQLFVEHQTSLSSYVIIKGGDSILALEALDLKIHNRVSRILYFDGLTG